MKHQRAFAYGASATILSVTLAVAMFGILGDVPVTSAKATGIVLSALELAPSERIVVDYVASGCRSYHNWSFVLFGGPYPSLEVTDSGGSYDSGENRSNSPSPIGAISLSARDCKGIDDLLHVYRNPEGTSGSTTTINIRVSYYRGDEKIGMEEFIDEGRIESWIYLRDEDGVVSVESRLTPEIVSFPQLVRRAAKAHQSTELALGAVH